MLEYHRATTLADVGRDSVHDTRKHRMVVPAGVDSALVPWTYPCMTNCERIDGSCFRVCIQTGSHADKHVFVHEYFGLQVRASFALVYHFTLHGIYE